MNNEIKGLAEINVSAINGVSVI